MSNCVHIGCDHAAIDLKNEFIELLKARGLDVVNHGTDTPASCDYPDIAHDLCRAMAGDPESRGVLLCGTGIGMSLAANRHPHIRAALCCTELHARLTRQHNNANVLCVGARMTGPELAKAILNAFLDTEFEGGRHQRRVDKLNAVEA